jgi:hypothetical protein
VVAVNEAGELLTISLPEDATVVLINKTTTSTNSTFLDRHVAVFPNPTSEEISIRLEQVKGLSVEAFDALGQKVMHQPFTTSNLHFDVSQWQPGVYWLKVHTEKGVANRRILIH